jgi:hypothetical protein
MSSHHTKDYDDTTRRPIEWWGTIDGEGPKPYATATWAYFQTVVEVDEAESPNG